MANPMPAGEDFREASIVASEAARAAQRGRVPMLASPASERFSRSIVDMFGSNPFEASRCRSTSRRQIGSEPSSRFVPNRCRWRTDLAV